MVFQRGRFAGNGWVIGHMGEGVPRTRDVGVKWAFQPKGDAGWEWRRCGKATTLSVLISGRFLMEFRNAPGGKPFAKRIIFKNCGDYAIFDKDVEHRSKALEDTWFLTIRWPSKQGDCGALKKKN